MNTNARKKRYRASIRERFYTSEQQYAFDKCMDIFDGQSGDLSQGVDGQSFSSSLQNVNNCKNTLRNLGLSEQEIQQCR